MYSTYNLYHTYLVNDSVWGMILAEWVTETTSPLVQTLNPYPVHVEVNKPLLLIKTLGLGMQLRDL